MTGARTLVPWVYFRSKHVDVRRSIHRCGMERCVCTYVGLDGSAAGGQLPRPLKPETTTNNTNTNTNSVGKKKKQEAVARPPSHRVLAEVRDRERNVSGVNRGVVRVGCGRVVAVVVLHVDQEPRQVLREGTKKASIDRFIDSSNLRSVEGDRHLDARESGSKSRIRRRVLRRAISKKVVDRSRSYVWGW